MTGTKKNPASERKPLKIFCPSCKAPRPPYGPCRKCTLSEDSQSPGDGVTVLGGDLLMLIQAAIEAHRACTMHDALGTLGRLNAALRPFIAEGQPE